MNPQKYVTTEQRCGTITKSDRGDYYLYDYFTVMQQQNLFFHKQNPLGNENKSYQKFLGVYSSFSAIDYYEAERLQHLSAKFLEPESIDLDALYA